MGLPIGSITVNETMQDHECDGWLLDGQQRVSTICEWLAGGFDVRGHVWSDLPGIERAHFERLKIPVLVTALMTRAEYEDVYDRLVYGGTPHKPQDVPSGSMR